MENVENLVFEGGGVLGHAYIGVAQALEERGIVAKRFAGSSAGAMAAGLMACRATSKQVEAALNSLDLSEMLDTSYFPPSNAYRLWYKGGWAKGNRLEEWYGNLIANLCDGQRDITLQQVYEKFGTVIVITCTWLQLHDAEYFWHKSHPDMSLVRAVRISSGFPAVYPMIVHDDFNWWDGGLADNYPMHVFDNQILSQSAGKTSDQSDILAPKHCKSRTPNPATIGFKLVSTRENCCDGDCVAAAHAKRPHHQTSTEINNVYDALKSVATMVFQMSRRLHVHEIDWKRSVIIDVGANDTLDFQLPESEKKAMIERARNATSDYLDALSASAVSSK